METPDAAHFDENKYGEWTKEEVHYVLAYKMNHHAYFQMFADRKVIYKVYKSREEFLNNETYIRDSLVEKYYKYSILGQFPVQYTLPKIIELRNKHFRSSERKELGQNKYKLVKEWHNRALDASKKQFKRYLHYFFPIENTDTNTDNKRKKRKRSENEDDERLNSSSSFSR